MKSTHQNHQEKVQADMKMGPQSLHVQNAALPSHNFQEHAFLTIIIRRQRSRI